MENAQTGQVTQTAAEVYDGFFVPALFAEWARPVADAVGVHPGHRALDVACGTGVLTREFQRRVQPEGTVVGVDRNEGMLDVAKRSEPAIEWKLAQAEALPFDEASFDTVGCQFGLMFFENRALALREMWRVLRPGGRLAVAVWGALETSPGYLAMVNLLQSLFGEAIAAALRAPFCLGDSKDVVAVLGAADITNVEMKTRTGTARFPSIEAWVHTDVKGWTLAELIDEAQYETLQRHAPGALRQFEQEDGTVAFASPAHIAIAQKT